MRNLFIDTPSQFEVVSEFQYLERLCTVIPVVRSIIVKHLLETKETIIGSTKYVQTLSLDYDRQRAKTIILLRKHFYQAKSKNVIHGKQQ